MNVETDSFPTTFDSSIRIKVNNICQWTCTFCHNEDTEIPTGQQKRVSVFLDPSDYASTLPLVTDMPYTPEVLQDITELRSYGINEIHITGGEPTLHSDLPNIARSFRERGFFVKITTNGQSSPKMIRRLKEANITGMTFSIFAIDPENFLKTQRIRSKSWAQAMIEKWKHNILLAKGLGIDVKINTVVIDESDFPRVDAIRGFAEANGIKLALLTNLGDQAKSLPAVINYANQQGTYVGGHEYTNNSKGILHFKGSSGNLFDARYIKPNHPEVVCVGCEHNGKDTCVEKYYGIRMEFREGKPYVRLCVQQTNERTVIPLQEFRDRGIIYGVDTMIKEFTPTVGVLVIKEDRVLLVRHSDAASHEMGTYGLPAGKIEEGEYAFEAAIREMRQETGITTTPEDLTELPAIYRRTLTTKHGDKNFTLRVFRCNGFNGELRSSSETVPEWIRIEDLEEYPLLGDTYQIIHDGLASYTKEQ